MGWPQEVLDFWFGLAPDSWWKADPELDKEIVERFRELWEEQRQCSAEAFLATPEEALAAVILFDQFPRNMFRGHADSFSTDHLALSIGRAAIDRGYDDALTPQQRGILYMPFQHSEDMGDQLRSIGLFTALGDPDQLRASPVCTMTSSSASAASRTGTPC
jgi:uncharacterized protein (DUF924 family)